jgi:AraC-like DNA-binding protein
MIGYVQKHYQESIALRDIAAAGSMCRSGCSDVFRKVLHQSPVAYLTDYRVQRSAELLCDTALPVTEIALQCGFSSPSYFAEVFRERMGFAPSEYRKRL